METLSQIKNNLKDLRLKSMSDILQSHIDIAIESKLSYQDFLLMLTQNEIDHRRNNRRELSLKKSNMGRIKRIEEFDFEFNPNINRQTIMKFVSCNFVKNNENIIIVGPTGVGKTFIAKALGYEIVNKGYSVLFVRTNKMLEDIYSGKADNTFIKRINKYIKPNLLILDDWGMTEFNDYSLHILNELISERYENGSIIITSNRPLENWDELFREKVIGSALLDRLFHQANRIVITGKSYRQGGKNVDKN
jgi:DNA replication protein DnaC